VLEIYDRGERNGVEAGSAARAPSISGCPIRLFDVVRLDAAAVEDAKVVGRRRAEFAADMGADEAMGVGGDFRGGGFTVPMAQTGS